MRMSRRALSGLGALLLAAALLPWLLGSLLPGGRSPLALYGVAITVALLGLPEMSGFEVARQLREQPGTRDALLVAVTGWGQEEDRRHTQEAGFDVHLTKPVNPEELGRVLATASR